MRQELADYSMQVFSKMLAARLPDFRATEDTRLPGNAALWEQKVRTNLSFYVLLQLHDTLDEFTVEVGWSTHGSYPLAVSCRLPRDIPELGLKRAEPQGGQFRARLAKFWSSKSQDPWWQVSPDEDMKAYQRRFADYRAGKVASPVRKPPTFDESAPIIRELIADAIGKLEQYAVPFFEEAARLQLP